MYFNVNFNVFFKSIKVHLLVSELYIHQIARCNDKKKHSNKQKHRKTHKANCGPGSSVGIATGYELNGPGIESLWGRDFPHLSKPALGPTQPPVQ